MARNIVAGNWKMNKLSSEAQTLFKEINEGAEGLSCELIVCPPAIYLQGLADMENKLKVGAQNVSAYDSGAYTGEWSAAMLKSLNLDYCIVGHSERRSLFGERDQDVNDKVKALLQHDISPIVCCGETLSQREAGEEKKVVKNQLLRGLQDLSQEDFKKVVIAYEPVWAIGTGVTATADQAQEMHSFIRSVLSELIGSLASEIPLLYGGSCKPGNAKELFACKDIDGGLIGGASLQADSFLAIAKSF